MSRTIILDNLYLNNFIASAGRSGIYDLKNIPINAQKCRLPEKYKAVLSDILLLFEDVRFYLDFEDVFDMQPMPNSSDIRPFFPWVLVDGLLKFVNPQHSNRTFSDLPDIDFDSAIQSGKLIIPDEHLESTSSLNDELDNELRSKLGISFYSGYSAEPGIIGFRGLIKNSLDQANDRKMLDRVIGTWPLVPKYFLQKKGITQKISLTELQHWVGMYLTATHDQIIKDQKARWPQIKSKEMAIDNFCHTIALILDTSWQVDQIIEEALSVNATCSLPVEAGNETANQELAKNIPYTVVQVLINQLSEEGLIIPDVTNLKTVLRLRAKKEISDFRNTLWEWFSQISNGNIDEMEKVRIEMKKSNNAIKKLGKFRKLNNILLYLALPSVAVDALLQLPITGTALALSGLKLNFQKKSIKKQIGWRLLLTRD